MDTKNTETEKNLKKAFEQEALRSCEYLIYSYIARLAGYNAAGREFEILSNHARAHTKLWYKWLYNGNLPHIISCVENAITQDKHDAFDMYPEFAQKARDEGFGHIADLFEHISKVEQTHTQRLQKLLQNVKDDAAPNPDGTFNWECSNCGAIITQKDEPEFCPLCSNEEVFFFKK